MKRRLLIALGVLVAGVALWFSTVDWCWFEDRCRRCDHSWTVLEYRFCTIPVSVRRKGDYPTGIELVASDLGVPCRHPFIERWRAQWWPGLCLMADAQNGMKLVYPSWYPPCARDAIRALREREPGFPAEYRRRVIERGDLQLHRELIFRMYDACPPECLPAHPLKRQDD